MFATGKKKFGQKADMNRKKKVPDYQKQKRAFDLVFETYRQSKKQNGLAALNWKPSNGKTLPDLARPTWSEFRADVEILVEKVLADKYHQRFWAAYSWFDSVD